MNIAPFRPGKGHRLAARRLGLLVLNLMAGASALAQVDHVIHISMDGLGGTYLQEYVRNTPEEFPNFVRLATEGAGTFNARCDYFYSVTIPNHATMLTGRPVLQPAGMANTVHHGYYWNSPGPADTLHANGNPHLPYKPSVLDVVHDCGLTTAFLASKRRMGVLVRSYDAENGAPDPIQPDHGRSKIDFFLLNDGPSSDLVDVLIANLAGPNPWHYVFLHLLEPDAMGHGYGWGTATWRETVKNMDLELGRLFRVIDETALRGRTAIVLTTDHGGGGGWLYDHSAAYHRLNYTIPLFVWGAGLPAGTDLHDLFFNRADPGEAYLDYNVFPQPLRNGDSPNLVLRLLGLPPVPGSLMIPLLRSEGIALTMRREGTGVTVSWPASATGFVLETAPSLATGSWVEVTAGIRQDGAEFVCTVPGGDAARFFRLRQVTEPAGN